MVERTGFLDGEPCWADVTAPDLDAARQFYGAVMGWTFVDSGPEFGHYTHCVKDGKKVAAITPPAPGSPQAPPIWNVYLATSDAGAMARAIDAAGGKVAMGPVTIPANGTMLYAFDPSGAAFGVWQGAQHIGSDLYNEVGAMCWAEVSTRDPGGTDAFYHNIFGYQQNQIGDGGTASYTFWTVPGGDGPVAGRLTMTDDWDGIAPAWMVYFTVENTDAAAARVTATSGSVLQGPFDSPYGRLAIVADPHGAVLTLIDPSHPTP